MFLISVCLNVSLIEIDTPASESITAARKNFWFDFDNIARADGLHRIIFNENFILLDF